MAFKEGTTKGEYQNDNRKTIYNLIIFAVIVVAFGIGIKQLAGEDNVDFRVKVLSFFSRILFYSTGAYEGSGGFNRGLWDGVQIYLSNNSYSFFHNEERTIIDHKINSTWKRDQRNGGYEIPIRIFLPPSFNSTEEDKKYPILIYFHGGGYVVGSIYDLFFDSLFRELSGKLDCILIGVEFRVAPEYKFPTALRDCYSVLSSVLNSNLSLPSHLLQMNIEKKMDENKVALAGDSAGGTIALNLAQLSRDRNEFGSKQPAHLILIYPCTYHHLITRSMIEYSGNNYLMPEGVAQWFHNQYVDYRTNHWFLSDDDDEDLNIDLLSPTSLSPASLSLSLSSLLANQKASENEIETKEETIKKLEGKEYQKIEQKYLNPWVGGFHQLPSIHLIITKMDPFRDESFILADSLKKAGVTVDVTFMEDAFHGFFILQFLRETEKTIKSISQIFQQRLVNH